jgi:hypothetical protein
MAGPSRPSVETLNRPSELRDRKEISNVCEIWEPSPFRVARSLVEWVVGVRTSNTIALDPKNIACAAQSADCCSLQKSVYQPAQIATKPP